MTDSTLAVGIIMGVAGTMIALIVIALVEWWLDGRND